MQFLIISACGTRFLPERFMF